MIRIYQRLKGMKKPERIEELKEHVLIDVIDPSDEELKWIEEKTKVPKEDISFFLDPEERSRIKKENYGIVIIFKYILLEDDEFRLSTIGIVVQKDLILVIHKKEIDFLEKLYSGEVKGFYTDKKIRVVLQIANLLVKDLRKRTKNLEIAAEKVEDELMKAMNPEDFIKYISIRRSLIYLNEAVIENGRILEAIRKGKVIKTFKSDREILDDMLIEMRQLLKTTEILNQAITSTMDGYASLVSLNIEKISRRLSALAIVLSVFVGISSIYGMNVLLPLQKNPNVFYYIIGLSTLLSLAFLVAFKKKGWM